jgi:hypothetical protein
MNTKRPKPRVNYPILKKGGAHSKSRKRARQQSKKEIRDESERDVSTRDLHD